MIKTIYAYPFEPMELEKGLNVIALDSPDTLYQFVSGLKTEKDNFVIADEEDQTIPIEKNVLFVGDPANDIDLEKLYLRSSIQKLISGMDLDEIHNIKAKFLMFHESVGAAFVNSDIPLGLNDEEEYELKTMISCLKPHFIFPQVSSFYDVIQTVLDTAGALCEKRTIVLMNACQYCSPDQVQYLQTDILRQDLQVICLERNDRRIDMSGVRNHFVDKDCVQF